MSTRFIGVVWPFAIPCQSLAPTAKGGLSRCRKAIAYTAALEKEQALHQLKAWAVQGVDVKIRTQHAHLKLFKSLALAPLPSLATLEANKSELLYEGRPETADEAVAAKPVAKRRKPKLPASPPKTCTANSSSSSSSSTDSSDSSDS